MDRVTVSKRGLLRLRAGHPWIYRSDLSPDPAGSIPSGNVVEVRDVRGQCVGTAFYSVHSKIGLRMVAHNRVEVDRGFLRQRLKAALALRQRIFPGARFLRLVHGEADLLPGLVVDRYGDHLSLQTLVPATDQRKEQICDLLEELLLETAGPTGSGKIFGIVERNDAKVRTLEGLDSRKGVVRGSYEGPTLYEEGDATMEIDLLHGQKTGAFLDQRENHLLAGTYAKGQALDLFSYVGGFALQLARQAESVRAVEISAQACGAIAENAKRSGRNNVEAVEANVFDLLRDELAEKKRYDTIVLDPPAFAKNKESVPAAIRGYKEVNLRALQLLAPGGVLITCTCSFHIGVDVFENLVREAACDSRRDVQVLERCGAGRDHPELLTVPETRYLKCLVLAVP